MDYICGVDVETTGLNPETDSIIEIGAVLFTPQWNVVTSFECFVQTEKPLREEIIKLTGITDDMLKRDGVPLENALVRLDSVATAATAFIAHNASFDKSFVTKDRDFKKPWYCSKGDVETHAGKTCTKLSHLALDYGLIVAGSKLHRAKDDVLLMGEMLKKTGLSFYQIRAYADEPWVYLKANVSYDDKELAKQDGYGWEKCHGTYNPLFPKSWVKRVKVSKLEEERSRNTGFKRTIISSASTQG